MLSFYRSHGFRLFFIILLEWFLLLGAIICIGVLVFIQIRYVVFYLLL